MDDRVPTTGIRRGEQTIRFLKVFYGRLIGIVTLDRSGWLRVIKGAISNNALYCNSHRMMRRYPTEPYLRCGEAPSP